MISQQLYTVKVINTTYNGLSVTINDGTKTKTITKNAVGNVIKMVDNGGTINYSYFANGSMKQASYDTNTVRTEIDGWGCKSINNNRKHFIRARELKDWLNANNINGLTAPKLLTGNNFESYIDGKKGIVYFEDYWARSTDTPPNRTGDHIDLWDGNELAGSTWIGTRFRLIFPWIAERFGTSDLRKSKKVIFWEIKD